MKQPPFFRALLILVGALIPGLLSAQTGDHQYSTADIEAGSRLYANQCALCHGRLGDQVAGVNLRRGQFKRFLSDDGIREVIASGVPGAGMPAFRLGPDELNGLVAFIRAGFDVEGTAVKIGEAAIGQTVYEGKGGCVACHRANGQGPRVAPDLSDIGAIRQASALQAKLIDPTASMLPINRPVTIVTNDGRTYRGRRLNEDTYTVQLIDQNEKLVSIDKEDIRTFELSATSPMPSVEGRLTAEETAHLIAYLLTLRGQ